MEKELKRKLVKVLTENFTQDELTHLSEEVVDLEIIGVCQMCCLSKKIQSEFLRRGKGQNKTD